MEQRKIFEYIIELGELKKSFDCDLIKKVGIRLKADSLTTANASIYCHRVLRQKDFPSDQICPYVGKINSRAINICVFV